MGFFPVANPPPSLPLTGGTLTGSLTVQGNISQTSLGTLTTSGVDVSLLGGGISIKEGSNAKLGIATLAAGTVTVANTSVTANSLIFCSCQILGTVTVASAFDTPRTVGTSFTIHASQATDTSTVAWLIVEPG